MRKNINKKLLKRVGALMLCGTLAAGACACGKVDCTIETEKDKKVDNTENAPKTLLNAKYLKDNDENEPEKVDVSDEFTKEYYKFMMKLINENIEDKKSENMMISPFSIMTALDMTKMGADGNTLVQMNKTLFGEMNADEADEMFNKYYNSLGSYEGAKFKKANSIWWDETEKNVSVKEDFLGNVSNIFHPELYGIPFTDGASEEINGWVSDKTDKMINKIVNEIPSDAIMFLINAIAFDAEWADEFKEEFNTKEEFTNADKSKTEVDMMHGSEYGYIEGKNVKGFIKPYKGEYSYVAILPDEDINIYDYLSSVSPEELQEIVKNNSRNRVVISMPKYEAETTLKLNDTLKKMGMGDAFDPLAADFSNMVEYSDDSEDLNTYIGGVVHKTYIEVNEIGTRAAAVTSVMMDCESAMEEEELKEVILNRPFMYMIIDNNNMLPVFAGVVDNMK